MLFLRLYIYDKLCIEQDLCLTNLSLSYLHTNPYICSKSNSLNLPFHANRKWNKYPNFIVVTLYFYPAENKYYRYIKFLESFASSNYGKVLLLVSFNISLYKMIISTKYISEINRNNKIFRHFHHLDMGYTIFKYKRETSFCYLFYTNILQNYFSKKFINSNHHTKNNKNYAFSGYYAAGTNLYSVIPFLLKIFDYFDYYLNDSYCFFSFALF